MDRTPPLRRLLHRCTRPLRPRPPRSAAALPRRHAHATSTPRHSAALASPPSRPPHPQHLRVFTTTPARATPAPAPATTPAPLSDAQYLALSDAFFESLLEKLEALQEDHGDLDVEYSAGVLNVTLGNGHTYVLNKQPPNRQIWLSSPVSGPKRYDWVVPGGWVYLRDASALRDLLREELGVEMGEAEV